MFLPVDNNKKFYVLGKKNIYESLDICIMK